MALLDSASAVATMLVDGPGEYHWAFLPGHSSGKVQLVLVEIDQAFRVVSRMDVHLPADLPPPESRSDIGFGDPRPFISCGKLWCLCTARQFNKEIPHRHGAGAGRFAAARASAYSVIGGCCPPACRPKSKRLDAAGGR